MGIFTDKKVTLVMSGGGAKGAYQIGMLRALEEEGLEKKNLTLAGTSIGAMNSLIYAIKDKDSIYDLLKVFKDALAAEMADPYIKTRMELIDKARQDVLDGKVSLEEYLHARRYYQMDNLYMIEAMRRICPDEFLLKNDVPVTVCVYSLTKQKPEYYKLNGLDPEDQRLLTIASGSIPFLSPAIYYKGDYYLDGGCIPEICKNPAPEDKIPVGCVKDIPCDFFIISYLKPEDRVQIPVLGGEAKVIEIIPSVPLEKEKDTGTLDFSDESLKWREELGYKETCDILSKMK